MLDLTVDPLITGLQITVAGVSIVFIALTLVALSLGLLGRINLPGEANSAAPAPAAAAPAPKPAAALPDGQVSPELIAVISAAAAAMFGQPVRVTSIRYDRQPGVGAWSNSGRISIMNSRRRQK